jgi:hypothetical protein
MTITITDYGRVDQRSAELGCLYPDGIAILPDNFETASGRPELLYRTSATTLRKALRVTSIPLSDLIPASERIPYITYKSFEWVAPTLFISAMVMSQNPTAVTVALGVLSNLITDFFKGIPGKKTAKLNVVVEKRIDKTCKKISYDGDIAGIISLAKVIKRISDE